MKTIPQEFRFAGIIFTTLLLLLAGTRLSAQAPAQSATKGKTDQQARWLDTKLSPEQRADALLAAMTLEEKIGQMTQPARNHLASESDIGRLGLGSVLGGGGSSPDSNDPESWADMYDRYQKEALKSRLGIPIIYGIDSVHGNNNLYGAVIFPHNIGMGATGNSGLVKEAARITALETAAVGIDWTFAPCVTVPQDERWGRTYEGFGEDTALVARLGAAAVLGLQGPSNLSELGNGKRILACAKHYLGDGGTLGGTDQGNTVMDEAKLRALFLPPYADAIKAGAGSVMVSFSSWNGVKMHQNRYLVTEVLKGELGFAGFVVSDWAGVKQIPGTSRTQVELAINAGIDMVMVPDTYREFIADFKAVVAAGKVSQARVDDAVRRILVAKFRLGLFEHPFADRSLIPALGSAAHRAVARQAARESLVVLKNNGKLLPLKKKGLRIGIVGDAADDVGIQCGGWTISWQGSWGDITPGTSIKAAIEKAVGKDCTIQFETNPRDLGPVDVAIVVGGELPYAEGKGDDSVLAWPDDGSGNAISWLKEKGVPVVTILLSGRPLDIREQLEASTAFVAAWLPGTEGDGIADILFGDFKPTGKLPYTWFATVGDIPVNATAAGPGVLFPRGYGLAW